jgi:hypothetical protein
MGKSTTHRHCLERPALRAVGAVFRSAQSRFGVDHLNSVYKEFLKVSALVVTKGSGPNSPHYCNDCEICCCCSHYRVTQSDIEHSSSKNIGVNGLNLWIFGQVLIIVSQ